MDRVGVRFGVASMVAALCAFGCGKVTPADVASAASSGAGAATSSGAGGDGGTSSGAGGDGGTAECPSGCLGIGFARQFDQVESFRVAVDGQGNILVTGYFDGTVDFGGGALVSTGNADAFVLKLDPRGNHVWSRRFGDLADPPDVQAGLAIAADASGNVAVGGRFGGTTDFGDGPVTGGENASGFVVLLDSTGNTLWSKHFGTESTAVRGVAFHPAGGIVVTGEYGGTVDLGGGPSTAAGESDIFVARLDASGSHLWTKHFTESGAVQPDGIALDAAGSLIFGGRFQGVLDFGGGPLESSETSAAIYLASLDPQGEHRWSRTLSGTNLDYLGLATDGAGDAVALGNFSGTLTLGDGTLTRPRDSVFVTKSTREGASVFTRVFSGAKAVAADASGNTWLTGSFMYEADFDCGPLTASEQALFVAGLDPEGNGLCSVHFDPSEYGRAVAIAVDPAGAPIVVGSFKGTIDFGSESLTSPPDKESMFVLKLSR